MKVVEINESDLRNTRFLKSLEEATQSHHLNLKQDMENNEIKSNFEDNKLLLFENIDIRNNDEGNLYSSLSSLIGNTKQPIVITCSHVPDEILGSPVLIQNLSDNDSSFRIYSLERHLLFICLAEFQYFPSIQSLLELCYYLKHDQRKILHSLQFWHKTISKNNQFKSNENNNLLKLIAGLPTNVNYNNIPQLLDIISITPYEILRHTKFFCNFPISLFIEDNDITIQDLNNQEQQSPNIHSLSPSELEEKKKYLSVMNNISDAYAHFSAADVFCKENNNNFPFDDSFPSYNYSCDTRRKTDFRQNEELDIDIIHPSKEHSPQLDGLTEQIAIYYHTLAGVQYFPHTFNINSQLEIDIEFVTKTRFVDY